MPVSIYATTPRLEPGAAARGRIAHLTTFFGRAARAAALTTYQIRQYQLARRADRERHEFRSLF